MCFSRKRLSTFFLHPIEQRIKSGLDVATRPRSTVVRRQYASGSCQFEIFSLVAGRNSENGKSVPSSSKSSASLIAP